MTLESRPFKMKAKNISTYKPFNGKKKPSDLREAVSPLSYVRWMYSTGEPDPF